MVLAAGSLPAATPTFQHDVLPLLEQRCLSCHSAKPFGQLDLRTLDSVMAGGTSGRVVMPGKPAESLLWKRVESGQMPMGG
ncbi:MAG: c-type cytochrome domain-containing protein, partial [Bryobacteraceae bacterium]